MKRCLGLVSGLVGVCAAVLIVSGCGRVDSSEALIPSSSIDNAAVAKTVKPVSFRATFQGTLRFASGAGVRNGTVSIAGTSLKVKTGVNGGYRLALTLKRAQTLQVCAKASTGSSCQTVNVVVKTKTYTNNFSFPTPVSNPVTTPPVTTPPPVNPGPQTIAISVTGWITAYSGGLLASDQVRIYSMQDPYFCYTYTSTNSFYTLNCNMQADSVVTLCAETTMFGTECQQFFTFAYLQPQSLSFNFNQ